jgi:hypothetical protein
VFGVCQTEDIFFCTHTAPWFAALGVLENDQHGCSSIHQEETMKRPQRIVSGYPQGKMVTPEL